MEQTGQTLTMTGAARYRGNSTHNGNLLKIHDNSLTTSYSKLTTAVGVAAQPGFGVYIDPATKNNAVTTVKPAGGLPAGILVRNPAITSGYPAAPNEINDVNKADRALQGYVEYSSGFDPVAGTVSQGIADIKVGMKLYINDLNGRPTFASAPVAGHTAFGTVLIVNPDTKKWTVRIEV